MKPSDFATLLLDLDGTLTDSAPGITASVRHAIGGMGLALPEGLDLRVFVGPPLHASFMKYLSLDDEGATRAVGFYREYYREKGIFDNSVYPGVAESLAELKRRGKTILLATSKPQNYAGEILAHFSLAGFFDAVHGTAMDASKSTKADVIRAALAGLTAKTPEGDARARCLMVGDRKEDIVGARECGIASCGALWGYGSREELAGANYVISGIKELID